MTINTVGKVLCHRARQLHASVDTQLKQQPLASSMYLSLVTRVFIKRVTHYDGRPDSQVHLLVHAMPRHLL